MNFHCEFSSRFHSDSKRIRSGFESKRRESPRIHNVLAQQYGFANFGRVFTVIRCETLSWVSQVFNLLRVEKERSEDADETGITRYISGGCRLHRMQFDNTVFGIRRINLLFQVAADSIPQNPL